MLLLLLGINLAFILVGCILYVLFGQLTVKKLRKNPDTKDLLGLSFVSGWDIINVAQSLALPGLSRKIRRGCLSSLEADPDLLFKHTNKFDRALGVMLYWNAVLASLGMIIIIVLNAVGLLV